MTRIDTDLFYLLCAFASMGAASTAVVLFRAGSQFVEWFNYWRGK